LKFTIEKRAQKDAVVGIGKGRDETQNGFGIVFRTLGVMPRFACKGLVIFDELMAQ